MTPEKTVELPVLHYLKKKESWVTFKELYIALPQSSKQGIRNCIYKLEREGIIERSSIKSTRRAQSRVKFKLKQP